MRIKRDYQPLPSRLRLRFKQWRRITDDPVVLSIVLRGLKVLLVSPPQVAHSSPLYRGSLAHQKDLKRQISEWLEQGVIEESCSGRDILSLLFPVPKANGKLRWCLDLRRVNQWTRSPRIRLPGVKSTRRLLPRGAWFCRLDLTSAYQHVSMHRLSRRLLAFGALNRRFRFVALPFGLVSAPAFFTRLLRPVAAWLRRRGVCLVRYLDDFLIWGRSRAEANRFRALTENLLTSLGFLINEEKSVREATQRIEFLGFNWHSRSMRVFLPPRKVSELQRLARRVELRHRHHQLTNRLLATLLGKIVATLPVIVETNFRRHALQRTLQYGLRTSSDNWDAPVSLSATALRDCRWWQSMAAWRAARRGRPWRPTQPAFTVTTDASGTGLGGTMTGLPTNQILSARAEWSPAFLRTAPSSNLREATAVTKLLLRWAHHVPSGSTVLVRSDNSATVSAINRMGSRSTRIGRALEPLFRWALRSRVALTAAHIPGRFNTWADRLSRWTELSHEWGVTPSTLSWLAHRWPEIDSLTLDLFASAEHHLLPRFVTLRWCPEATATDAFSLSLEAWAQECPLIVPPIGLIDSIVGRLLDSEPPLVLLVTPSWPTASWWPILMQMAACARNSVELPPAMIRPAPHGASVMRRGPTPRMTAWLLRPQLLRSQIWRPQFADNYNHNHR
jgi:hypothetical protein